MKQTKNAFKAALARREAQIGLWLSLADGYVAVTPLHLDLTHEAGLALLAARFEEQAPWQRD